MKKHLLILFVLINTLNNTNGFAQSKLIHYWHFNNSTVPGAMYTYTNTAGTLITGIPADFSLIDTAKAKILYYLADVVNTNLYDSTYIDFYTPTAAEYDTVNLQMGALSGNAIKARNPSVKMELRFYIPTTNYKNIVIKYGTEASSRTSGQLLQNFDYSIDSGASWITTGLSMTSDSANLTYNLIGLNLASDHSVDNNNKLVFRIKFSGNTMLYAGNNRFDNVTPWGAIFFSSRYMCKPNLSEVASVISKYSKIPSGNNRDTNVW